MDMTCESRHLGIGRDIFLIYRKLPIRLLFLPKNQTRKGGSIVGKVNLLPHLIPSYLPNYFMLPRRLLSRKRDKQVGDHHTPKNLKLVHGSRFAVRGIHPASGSRPYSNDD